MPSSHTTPLRKLSPKQRVLEKYPDAMVLWLMDDVCYIEDADGRRLGSGTAPKAAWADAARKL